MQQPMQGAQAQHPKHPVVNFELIEFNHVRYIRGKEAAKIRVIEDGEDMGVLWMSPADLEHNIRKFGPCEALAKALRAYGH